MKMTSRTLDAIGLWVPSSNVTKVNSMEHICREASNRMVPRAVQQSRSHLSRNRAPKYPHPGFTHTIGGSARFIIGLFRRGVEIILLNGTHSV